MPYFCSLAAAAARSDSVSRTAVVARSVAGPPAQDWDHDHLNGRDKIHDPTGTWLVRIPVIVPLNIEFRSLHL